MKKRIITVLVLTLCLVLSACSKKSDFTSVITGYQSGDVTLGQYRGLTYTPSSTEIEEEDVADELEALAESYAENVEITDRTAAADGDIVNIDYTGYIDGETFDGGSNEDYELELGSNSFIDGFESGLVGAEVGSTVNLDLTFPETYSLNSDYAGKDVTFVVTLNGIYEKVVPEINDEFIAANTDYTTVEEYREYVRTELQEELESDAESQKKYDLINAAIANCTFNKDLSTEIQESCDSMIESYDSMYESSYGVDAATIFYYFYGMDEDTFNQYMYSQAELNTKYGYLAAAIVDEEGITATDDEIAELAASMLESYGYDTVDEMYADLETYYGVEGKEVVAEQVCLNKASDIIIDSAVAE